ncbi:MAG: serine hydrolase domain-containing protein [Limnohabitans sp.]
MNVGSQPVVHTRYAALLWSRTRSLIGGLACTCLGLSSFANGLKPDSSKSERIAMFRENVDKILQQLHTKQGPGLAVWVALDGEVIYKNWGGLAHREQRLPIDGNTAFELASAAKPLTATLALQLVESGGLKLEDKAVDWLPQLPKTWSGITVLHLLTHRAGIPDYMKQINADKLMMLDGLTNEKLMQRWVQSDPLRFAPGSSVEYSNSNYVLLAEIIAKACGKSFGQCMREKVLEPVGMRHTWVESESQSSVSLLALNYALTRRTKGIQLLTEGPTGIYSSLTDLAAWFQAFQSGQLVSPATASRMTQPSDNGPVFDNGDGYGMGWVLPADSAKEWVYAHAGQKDGYRTLMHANPHYKVSYIILSNGGDFVQQVSTEVNYWISGLFEGKYR